MASKADTIIDHFTSDPKLKAQIQTVMADIKAKKQQPDVDAIIKRFTTDPALTVKIKEIIKKAGAKHDMDSITGYHIANTEQSVSARDAVTSHKAVVQQILKS